MLAALLLALLLLQAPPADRLDELASAGQWSALRDLATERLVADSDDAGAHYWLGRDLLGQGLQLIDGDRVARDLARSFLDRAVKHLASAQAGGGAAPDTPDWLMEARWAQVRSAWAQGAGVALADALAADSEQAWAGEQLAMAAFVRGLLCEQRGETCALAWYERAAAAAPERSRFWQQLALTRAGTGSTGAAWDAFDMALEAEDAWLEDLLMVLETLGPGRRDAGVRMRRLERMATRAAWADDALLAWHQAHALFQLGRGDEALAAFEHGTRGRTPAIDRAHASHLLAADRPEQALELLLPRVRERDWLSLDHAMLAVARLAGARRHDEALIACDALLEVEPRHELVLWNRALILWKAGRDDEAEAAFGDLMRRSPGRSDVLNDAALAAWGAGRRERARTLLEQAVSLPGCIDAQENLALLLMGEGPEARARAAALLDAVLGQEPDRSRALAARHDLRVGH